MPAIVVNRDGRPALPHFRGWPEQQTYEGLDEARRFIREWTAALDDWEINVVAGDKRRGNPRRGR
jgi:hypothetical protein